MIKNIKKKKDFSFKKHQYWIDQIENKHFKKFVFIQIISNHMCTGPNAFSIKPLFLQLNNGYYSCVSITINQRYKSFRERTGKMHERITFI